MDPIELRRRNFIGEHTAHRQRHARHLERLPRSASTRSSARAGWKEQVPPAALRPRPRRRRQHVHQRHQLLHLPERDAAVGACSSSSTAAGAPRCSAARSDIGQGVGLGARLHRAPRSWGSSSRDVRVVAADTDLTPVDLGAYSSRETFMVGNACLDAARKLREQVAGALAERWGCAPSEVTLAGGVACSRARSAARVHEREGGVPARRGAASARSARSAGTRAPSSAATTAAARSAPRPRTRSPRTSPRSTCDVETGRVDGRRRSGSRTTAAARSTR